MAYSQAVVSRARAILAERRQAHEAEQAEHRALAYERYPRLSEIDTALRGTVAKAVAAAFSQGTDPAAAVEEAHRENQALQRERSWILEASDLGEDYLDEKPLCPLCGDTGYVGTSMCQCLQELCRQEQRKELTDLFLLGGERFEDFRLDVYSTTPDPNYGVSPRQNMTRVLRTVRAWAQNFAPGAGNLLFTGSTGLGKTFLSACVARKVSDLGYSVVYERAARLFADFEAEKFHPESAQGKSERYTQCDLLILDDLGTEMTTQFVVSALYGLVNDRLLSGKSTLISTNLPMALLRERYGMQTYSRLAGEYEGLYFFGEDLRLKKQDS